MAAVCSPAADAIGVPRTRATNARADASARAGHPCNLARAGTVPSGAGHFFAGAAAAAAAEEAAEVISFSLGRRPVVLLLDSVVISM